MNIIHDFPAVCCKYHFLYSFFLSKHIHSLTQRIIYIGIKPTRSNICTVPVDTSKYFFRLEKYLLFKGTVLTKSWQDKGMGR
jgi:hypothetical protein